VKSIPNEGCAPHPQLSEISKKTASHPEFFNSFQDYLEIERLT